MQTCVNNESIAVINEVCFQFNWAELVYPKLKLCKGVQNKIIFIPLKNIKMRETPTQIKYYNTQALLPVQINIYSYTTFKFTVQF